MKINHCASPSICVTSFMSVPTVESVDVIQRFNKNSGTWNVVNATKSPIRLSNNGCMILTAEIVLLTGLFSPMLLCIYIFCFIG